ncbi:MAG: hydrogenase formation protein HypD [Selenomonadaceae bacterium]|nr:hydrogenase formation protein HypD [Selenomonadaceae bacterium]
MDTASAAGNIAARIAEAAAECGRDGNNPLRFMEVCGTHTVTIFRSGLRQLLPPSVELVSGPGCPVCVTVDGYIDEAVALAGRPEIIIAAFGDLLKVPGSASADGRPNNLAEAKARGADIRVVYSPLDALTIAADNPDKKVVYLAVGFETTAPTAAALVLAAEKSGLKNLFLLTAHKLVPPAMKAILNQPHRIDGFILPGHVAVVTGRSEFDFLTDYRQRGVVTGFEPLGIMAAILRLAEMTRDNISAVENFYPSVVREDGNPSARGTMMSVFEETDELWRGLGMLEKSGLSLRDEYAVFDAQRQMPLERAAAESSGTPLAKMCRCGDVLTGAITPKSCPLFGKACTDRHPVGPCMVSVEGTCAAWYKYGAGKFMFT